MPYLDFSSDRVDGTFVPGALIMRDFKERVKPNETQTRTLIVAGAYVVAIAILWHVPYLEKIIYPFKLLTVGFHEMSHAIVGFLTCARIESIDIEPNEGGVTRMKGGVQWLTLPAGYLGSSFIGACLVACGFNTNASKVATLVLAAFFLVTLWWARRDKLVWILLFGFAGLFVLFWFVAGGVALRYFVLFIGVMSCFYALWDIVDDTVLHRTNESDAAMFAKQYGCCSPRLWGCLWTFQALTFFALGVILGLVAFKQSAAEQKVESQHFLPVPGAHNGAGALHPFGSTLTWGTVLFLWLLQRAIT